MAEECSLWDTGLCCLPCLAAPPKLHELPLMAKARICLALCQSELTILWSLSLCSWQGDPTHPPMILSNLHHVEADSPRKPLQTSDATETERQQKSACRERERERARVWHDSICWSNLPPKKEAELWCSLVTHPLQQQQQEERRCSQTTERQQMLLCKHRHKPAQAIGLEEVTERQRSTNQHPHMLCILQLQPSSACFDTSPHPILPVVAFCSCRPQSMLQPEIKSINNLSIK